MAFNLAVYVWLTITTFLNILIPVSGSATVTPLLAIITDPHKAIALASFYFALGGVIRVYIFRKHIRWEYVKQLIILSFIGAIMGAFSLITLNATLLYIIILLFAIYFFYKKIKDTVKESKEHTKPSLTVHLIGLLSGFLQGTGLAGSDLRNSYLYSRKLDLAEVHGTTAFIGATNFITATIIRLFTNQITIPDLTILLYLFPLMVLATWLGKHVIYKINKKYMNLLILVIMFLIIVFLLLKIF